MIKRLGDILHAATQKLARTHCYSLEFLAVSLVHRESGFGISGLLNC